MAKKDDRKITLECTSCRRRNYATQKNKRNTPERLEIKKFCPFERQHLPHKEIK